MFMMKVNINKNLSGLQFMMVCLGLNYRLSRHPVECWEKPEETVSCTQFEFTYHFNWTHKVVDTNCMFLMVISSTGSDTIGKLPKLIQ